MVTLYKDGKTVQVWPVDADGWVKDGWSTTAPAQAKKVEQEAVKPATAPTGKAK